LTSYASLSFFCYFVIQNISVFKKEGMEGKNNRGRRKKRKRKREKEIAAKIKI